MKDLQIARILGWFSIGLGAAEIIAPGFLEDAAGLVGQQKILRVFGAREVLTGVGILFLGKPALGLWARVAGDALDVAAVAKAPKQNAAETRFIVTLCTLLGIGLLDFLYARRLSDRA